MSRSLKASVVLFVTMASVVVSSDTAVRAQQASRSSAALTVDDVIKMLDVKLAEDLLVAQIKKNNIPFQLSADDIVRLKNRGATDNILRVMLNPSASIGQPSVVTNLSGPAADLPQNFGFYVFDGSSWVSLAAVPVTTTFGLMIEKRGVAVDGIREDQHGTTVGSLSPSFIVYGQNLAAERLKLSSLLLVTSMTAGQFDISNTRPQFFPNVYGKNASDTVPVNLLRASPPIPLQVAPIDAKPGMFKRPMTTPLSPGRYVLYDGDALHRKEVVFTASPGRNETAYVLEVGTKSAASMGDIAGVNPGVVYALAADGSLHPLTRQTGTIWIKMNLQRQILLPADASRAATTIAAPSAGTFVLRKPTDPVHDLDVFAIGNGCAVYSFTLSSGRLAAEVKQAIDCSVDRMTDDVVKLTISKQLPAGHYAVARRDADKLRGQAPISVFAFRIGS